MFLNKEYTTFSLPSPLLRIMRIYSDGACRSLYQQGLSLIELAIGMIAVGVLAAAVLVGKELIYASHIQSIVSDVSRYSGAVLLFKEKYGELPGDFSGAAEIWGSQSCTNNGWDASNTTCTGAVNGDGDGHIQGYEMIQTWRHLTLARIIKGSFIGGGEYIGMGVNQTLGTNNNLGMTSMDSVRLNLPETALARVFVMAWYEGHLIGHFGVLSYTFNGFFRTDPDVNVEHVMVFGTPLASDGYNASPENKWPALYTADAMAIDIKADDGLPAQGRVQGLNWGSAMTQWNYLVTSCFITPSDTDFPNYRYNLAYKHRDACALAFLNVF